MLTLIFFFPVPYACTLSKAPVVGTGHSSHLTFSKISLWVTYPGWWTSTTLWNTSPVCGIIQVNDSPYSPEGPAARLCWQSSALLRWYSTMWWYLCYSISTLWFDVVFFCSSYNPSSAQFLTGFVFFTPREFINCCASGSHLELLFKVAGNNAVW